MTYTSTIQITRTLRNALKSGDTLPTGQWVREEDGTLARVVVADGERFSVSRIKAGESLKDRNERFQRAVWHAKHRHNDPVVAVVRAPLSVGLERLKGFIRTTFGKDHGIHA